MRRFAFTSLLALCASGTVLQAQASFIQVLTRRFRRCFFFVPASY